MNPETENGSQCANTESRQGEAQLTAGTSPASMPHDPELVSPRAKRFKRAEDDGIVATSRWIGHSAVREQVDWWRMPVHEILEPAFSRILAEDPDGVVPFAWAIYGVSGINSDFKPTNEDWSLRVYLTPEEKRLAPVAVRRFKTVVDKAAEGMRAAGAPVDTGWDGDLVVIATLLLAAEDCIPWDRSARDLAEWVYPPASTAITPDYKGIRSRLHVSQNSEVNVLAIRREYEADVHGEPTPAPYAGGKKRAAGRQSHEKAARIEALREVLAFYPEATMREIFDDWESTKQRPGSLYRHLLAQNLGITWLKAGRYKPTLRSLYRDRDEMRSDI